MLRFRTRNQHRRRNNKSQPPKFLMPRDVLRRNARSTPSESLVTASKILRRQFPLRMRVEIRPVAIKREHDEQFRIHPRGRNSRNRQKFDRRIQSLVKLHVSISPQVPKGRSENRRPIVGGLATHDIDTKLESSRRCPDTKPESCSTCSSGARFFARGACCR